MPPGHECIWTLPPSGTGRRRPRRHSKAFPAAMRTSPPRNHAYVGQCPDAPPGQGSGAISRPCLDPVLRCVDASWERTGDFGKPCQLSPNLTANLPPPEIPMFMGRALGLRAGYPHPEFSVPAAWGHAAYNPAGNWVLGTGNSNCRPGALTRRCPRPAACEPFHAFPCPWLTGSRPPLHKLPCRIAPSPFPSSS
jgi:hypothetical protein